MKSTRRRLIALTVLAGGSLFAGGCGIAEQVINTILYAFNIVDVWV